MNGFRPVCAWRARRLKLKTIVNTIVQSLDCHFFDLISRALHLLRPLETTVIAMPPTPIRRASAARIRPVASSMAQRRNVATRGGRSGNWLPLLLAATMAVDGWLTLGPLAQSTLIAAAVLRRLRSTISEAYKRFSCSAMRSIKLPPDTFLMRAFRVECSPFYGRQSLDQRPPVACTNRRAASTIEVPHTEQ
jgi:hypothetical protein